MRVNRYDGFIFYIKQKHLAFLYRFESLSKMRLLNYNLVNRTPMSRGISINKDWSDITSQLIYALVERAIRGNISKQSEAINGEDTLTSLKDATISHTLADMPR
ncbi:hypothetical protein UF37_16020 [Vibrio parahaemolyticus]|nr:hypothetical protein UF37_16020 [Vibrio parahaemolyticus]